MDIMGTGALPDWRVRLGAPLAQDGDGATVAQAPDPWDALGGVASSTFRRKGAARHPPGAHGLRGETLFRFERREGDGPRPIRALAETSFRRRTFSDAGSMAHGKRRPKSKIHRHEEAVDAGLASTCVVPIKDPIIPILAWQRLTDGDATNVAIDRIILV